MLLVLFNKIRVHSYHTVLRLFHVSSLVPLIVDNDPIHKRCVGGHSVRVRVRVHHRRLQAVVTTVRVSSSRQGLRLGLGLATRHIKKLGLRRLGLSPVARGRSRVTDEVTGSRQGALRVPRRLCDRKPEVPPKLGAPFAWSFPLIKY